MSLGAVGAAILALAMQSGTEVPYTPAVVPAPGASVCPDGICGAEALEGLFEALAATEAGTRDRPVHVLQIGDSHTAGDRITGALRARLQARFGAAGRGVLPPGVPYAGYAPFQVQMSGWSAPPAPAVPPGGAPTASTGLTGTAAVPKPGETLTLTADPVAAFDTIGLCLQGGRVSVRGGDEIRTVAPDADDTSVPVCSSVLWAEPLTEAVVSTTGAARIHDLWIGRSGPGVLVSNLGVVGATLRDLAARDEAVVSAELAAWRPALVVLAYGVNEGFEDGVDPVAYADLLRGQIERLRRLAPGAALLILGAPEGLKAGTSGPCGGRSAPASLAVVRDVQRRVAEAQGVAYWDWQGRMGGDCSAERLATTAEPYMRPDRVHFTSVGADWMGGVLSDDLLGAYDRWKGEH